MKRVILFLRWWADSLVIMPTAWVSLLLVAFAKLLHLAGGAGGEPGVVVNILRVIYTTLFGASVVTALLNTIRAQIRIITGKCIVVPAYVYLHDINSEKSANQWSKYFQFNAIQNEQLLLEDFKDCSGRVWVGVLFSPIDRLKIQYYLWREHLLDQTGRDLSKVQAAYEQLNRNWKEENEDK